MDNQLKRRLTRDIIIMKVTGSDLYGDPTYDDGTPMKAYRHGKVETVTSFTGEEVVSRKQFICDGLLDISDGDVLIEDGKQLPIKATSVFDGLAQGTGTTVIYL